MKQCNVATELQFQLGRYVKHSNNSFCLLTQAIITTINEYKVIYWFCWLVSQSNFYDGSPLQPRVGEETANLCY